VLNLYGFLTIVIEMKQIVCYYRRETDCPDAVEPVISTLVLCRGSDNHQMVFPEMNLLNFSLISIPNDASVCLVGTCTYHLGVYFHKLLPLFFFFFHF
jgi:hypothetical protein